METADRKKLGQCLFAQLIFPAGLIGMFWLFISTMFPPEFAKGPLWGYMLLGFSVLFFGVIAHIISSTMIDLRRGVKNRISGRVTDKRLNTVTTGNHAGSRGTLKSRREYYLYLDDREYTVEYSDFTKAVVGMEVVMDMAPRSGLTLDLQIVNQAPDRDASPKEGEDQKFLETRIPHARYSQKDHEALERIWKAEKRKHLIGSAPFATIGLMMLLSGLWSFVVVLFPLWAVPLYHGYKFFLAHGNYNKNKFRSHKRGVVALVENKSTFTSNRHSNAHGLMTTIGRLTVDTRVYDKLSVGDRITIYMTQYGNVPISILTEDDEEMYLV